ALLLPGPGRGGRHRRDDLRPDVSQRHPQRPRGGHPVPSREERRRRAAALEEFPRLRGGVRVKLLPAIDLLDGKVVTLVGGVPGTETIALPDPLRTYERWIRDGAEWVHLVDLD